MNCQRYRDAIQASVDDALPEEGASDLARHLERCTACRSLEEDLRAIRVAAAELPPIIPPEEAWPRLAAELVSLQSSAAPIRARRDARGVLSLLAAAAVIAIAIVGSLTLGRRMANRPNVSVSPSTRETTMDADLALQVAAELRQAEAHYEKAIRGLELITRAEPASLDARLAAALQTDLSVIDRAIDESRVALRAEPDSEPAQQSLLDAYESKVTLLRDTVALILTSDMDRTDDAGTARAPTGERQ